ncbi:MAG: hypothetical protein ACRDKK_04030 [Gaiellaceae bacterium]
MAERAFRPDERDQLERRWNDVQARFVDEPRGSVEEANTLVDELMQRLVSSFSEERARLEAQWDRGDEITPEDLRVALQRYRSFFGYAAGSRTEEKDEEAHDPADSEQASRG